MSSLSDTYCLVREFRNFVAVAESLCAFTESHSPSEEFKTFVRLATPHAVEHLKTDLVRLRERTLMASRWWTPHDLLLEGGLSYVENAYTRLMAWALNPATDPPTAVLRQKAWLRALALNGICETETCAPITQLVTNDGIPDLVLRYRNAIVVVEAKTGSSEHAAPSGAPQTSAYIQAVRKRWGLPPEFCVEVVFISPDGAAAQNLGAKATTFAGFALALAAALDQQPLSPQARGAFSILFTHFISCSGGQAATRRLIEQVIAWSARSDWNDDEQILRHMTSLQAAMLLFRLEEAR